MTTHREAIDRAVRAGLNLQIEGPLYDLQNRIAETIIKTYLDARDLVMVPRAATDEMVRSCTERGASGNNAAVLFSWMLAAAPDPFKDDAP